MEREEIKKRLYKILNETTDVNTMNVEETDYFNNDLGLDSLQAVELVVEIEKEFKISLEDEYIDVIHQSRVSDVIDMLQEIVK